MSRKAWFIVGLSALYSTGMVIALPALSQQPEPAIACPEASPPLSIAYGEHTVDCMIDTVADVDTFRFDGENGDLIRVVLSEVSSPSIELRLQVRGPTGGVLLDQATGGNFRAELTLTEDGEHTLSVSDNGADEVGGYEMQLERIPPPILPPLVQVNTSVTDAVDHISDIDFWLFCASQGDEVRLSLSETTSPSIELHLEVWDPSGSLLVDERPGTNIGAEVTLPDTGCYLIATSDSNHDEIGGYELGIQCLFGTCLDTADLVASKSSVPDPVLRGEALVYTVGVENIGPSDAQNVIVNDQLPAEVVFVSTSGCNNDPIGVPDCELGTVVSDSLTQYQINVTVTALAPEIITNTASVRSTTTEGLPGDETATTQTMVLEGDVIFEDDFEGEP